MSEVQYNTTASISVDLIPDVAFSDIRKDALKQAQYTVNNQVNREVTRCVWQYINRYQLNPVEDIMMITDADGISYFDIKHQREILHKSFPLSKETKDALNTNIVVSVILRKNYE